MSDSDANEYSAKEQPNPIHNRNKPVWDSVIENITSDNNIASLVIKDMKDRNNFGISRYGTPLQIFNGRDAITDCYQEYLDAIVYLKQALLEAEDLNHTFNDDQILNNTFIAMYERLKLDLITLRAIIFDRDKK